LLAEGELKFKKAFNLAQAIETAEKMNKKDLVATQGQTNINRIWKVTGTTCQPNCYHCKRLHALSCYLYINFRIQSVQSCKIAHISKAYKLKKQHLLKHLNSQPIFQSTVWTNMDANVNDTTPPTSEQEVPQTYTLSPTN